MLTIVIVDDCYTGEEKGKMIVSASKTKRWKKV